MADTPINLNRVRKERTRAGKRAKADANAVKFGRSKATREAEEKDRDRSRRTLDQHCLDGDKG